MYSFPNIDPVIFRFSESFAITWYSLSYVLGIILGWIYLKYINRIYNLKYTDQFLDEVVTWSILGIVIGGRLGYVLFYDLSTYLLYPMEIFKTWKGGMSFHGGLLGLAIAMIIVTKIHKESILRLTDAVSCVAPIGLCLGRIANFINGELYGRETDVAWGIIFPNAGNIVRHPSQLYEAFLEGVVILLVQYLLLKRTKIIQYKGLLTASFLLQYCLYRMFIELFREPDAHLGFFAGFTMGQILSLPMFIMALYLIIRSLVRR